MNELLKINNISFKYKDTDKFIIKDLSFVINKWEIVSIIWLNWSGKTTLLKIIAGILKEDSGNIERNYKSLSYVPQKINLDNTFPLEVREFLLIYNEKVLEKDILRYLEEFNISYLYKKNLSDLSGGELQKVLIISALLSNPELIILDEPTASIDIVGEEKFYGMIWEIKNHFPSVSILLVSHNINLVYKYSNKVICLHEDNYCCHGTKEELKNNKILENIFSKYVSSYVHNPHEKHN